MAQRRRAVPRRKIKKIVVYGYLNPTDGDIAETVLFTADTDLTLVRIVGNLCIHKFVGTVFDSLESAILLIREGDTFQIADASAKRTYDGRDGEKFLWHCNHVDDEDFGLVNYEVDVKGQRKLEGDDAIELQCHGLNVTSSQGVGYSFTLFFKLP